MVTKDIKYLVLSDIHLGHNINKSNFIVDNLDYYFKKNIKLFRELDYLFLAGDVFDKLLVTSGKDFLIATEWLTNLITFCTIHNIKLRILEGTPSHDWNQCKVISTIIEKLKLKLDYKYIDTLYIENDNGFTILYVPDEYKHKASDTLEEVKKLLIKENLTNVDIAIMHGQFHYQIPMVRLESSHDEDEYLNIVKYFISIGHIHTSSIYERILAQGSFDRLAHNEEEDKGGMYIHLTPTSSSYQFIKNDTAMIFKTYRFENESVDEIVNILQESLTKYPSGSNIRIICKEDEYLYKSIDAIRSKFPTIRFKIDKPKKEETMKVKLLEETEAVGFAITKDNIIELLSKELEHYNFTEREYKIFRKEIEETISSIV